MSTKFRRILFDYDGTLIIHNKETEGTVIADLLGINPEKREMFIERLNYLFASAYGRDLYKNRKMTYHLFYSIIDYLMNPAECFSVSAKEISDAINYKSAYLTELAPNAKEILEYLKNKGYELCIFTNGFYKDQGDSLRAHGIYDYFERIYAWDNWYTKPDLRAIRRALAGTMPSENVMIGDSLNSDIIPAKKQGVYTIGCNIENVEDKLILPDVIITDLAQLKQIL